MKIIQKITAVVALVLGIALPASITAQTLTDHSKIDMPQPDAAMTEGEIKKVDKSTKKVTIKHGEIKNLDMPGMTMVFQVKDSAMLDMVKTGDKVKFKVEKAEGAIVVTEMQVAK